MPDAHSGKGSAVGTVIPTLDAVIPAAVGVVIVIVIVIVCGMIAARTIFSENDIVGRPLVALRESLESAIPLSPGNYNRGLDRYPFTKARVDALQQMADDEGVDVSHSPKSEQLGSLGGGNHFIELCLAYKDIDVVMTDAAELVEIEHELRHVLNLKGT